MIPVTALMGVLQAPMPSGCAPQSVCATAYVTPAQSVYAQRCHATIIQAPGGPLVLQPSLSANAVGHWTFTLQWYNPTTETLAPGTAQAYIDCR